MFTLENCQADEKFINVEENLPCAIERMMVFSSISFDGLMMNVFDALMMISFDVLTSLFYDDLMMVFVHVLMMIAFHVWKMIFSLFLICLGKTICSMKEFLSMKILLELRFLPREWDLEKINGDSRRIGRMSIYVRDLDFDGFFFRLRFDEPI